jgi:SAM-dependent methyltransferase
MTMTQIANAEMISAWDGEEGDRWTRDADRYEAAGPWYGQRLLADAGIADGSRVLDVGCGTGALSRDAARRAGSGSVVGVDLSTRMTEFARERARDQGLHNVSFLRADAQVHPFEAGSFDIAVSSFGAMFFEDPVSAFRNIAGALRPPGRLAMLVWQELGANEWLASIRQALAAGRDLPSPPAGTPGPFGLADPEGTRRILTDAGYDGIDLAPLTGPMRFGDDADDAWQFVRTMGIVKGMTADLDEDVREASLAELRRVLAAHQSGDGVIFDSSAWLITGRVPG